MRGRYLFGTLLVCLGLLFLVQPVMADSADGVNFDLKQADLTGTPGSTLIWMFDVTNSNTNDKVEGLFVSGGGFSGGTPDSSIFNTFTIDGVNSATGDLFSFNSDPTVSNSFNNGSFDLTLLLVDKNTGSTTPLDLVDPYSATIAPSSTNIPEPGGLTLLALGLACCLALSRKLF